MIRLLLHLTLIFCSNGVAQAQTVQKSFPADTARVRRYLHLAEEVMVSDPLKAQAYNDSALLISRKINEPKFIALSLTSIGTVHRMGGDFPEAHENFLQAISVSPPMSPWLRETYLEDGITLLRMSEHDSSMHTLERGLQLISEYPDRYTEASIYNMMGNVRRAQNQYNEALEAYIKSVKLFEESEDHKGLAQALSNIGNIHNLMGETDLAMTYAKRSLESAVAAGVRSSIAYSNALIGRIYRKQKKLDEALRSYQEAARIYREINFTRETGETLLSIGNIYFDKNDHRQALREYLTSLGVSKSIHDSLMMTHAYVSAASAQSYLGQFREARSYLDSTIAIAAKKRLPTQRMDAYQVMSEILEMEGNYKASKEYYIRFISLRDSLTEVQNREQAQEIEARFQSEKKDDAIRILNAENQLRETQQVYLVVFTLLLIAVAGVLYNRYKVKLKANEKLRELDQIKSRFFANISHEFRTPLSLILGPVESMIADTPDGERRENLLLLQRNARRLKLLINQLLDLSRIESGTMELRLEESDIAHTLNVIAGTFSSLAERKGILFNHCVMQSCNGCYDREKVDIIITNLLSNAFKFTQEGGTVTMKCTVEEGRLTVDVSDSGIGIPQESLPKIFDRFFQVDDSQTRTSEGSGIGLSLSKELAELHRGTLVASSQEGVGSSFRLSIPVTREFYPGMTIHKPISPLEEIVPSASAGLPLAKSDEEHKSLLLIAEDNPDMQAFLASILRTRFRLAFAQNGVEAFERAVATVPDLIISDWMMPEMDGRGLCAKIKTTDITSHIPVLMLTARADQPSKLEGLETGADDYLVKPFDSRELLVRIDNIVEQRRRLREIFSQHVVLEPKQVTLPSRDADFVARMMDLLEEKFADPGFDVEQMAEVMCMSRMQLHRKVKALSDQSPGEFIRRFRLERAKQFLSAQRLQVSEVCFQSGFNNVSTFSRAFRDYTGVTPTEYAATASQKAKML